MPRAAPTTASSRCSTGDFTVEFFASPDLSGPVGARRDAWPRRRPSGSARVADGKVDPARYSARLTGTLRARGAAGTHRVGVFAAGLARVIVDGRLVADAWTGWKPGRDLLRGRLRRGRRHRRARRRPRLSRSSSSSPPSRRATLGLRRLPRRHRPAARRRRDRRGGRGRRAPPTSRWSSSAATANGTPRAATCPTSRCPAARTSWSPPSPPPTRAPSSCCRPAGRSRCPGSTPSPAVLAGLVSGPGGRQRHRRRAPRRRRARRPPAADLPARLGRQPDREPRPGGLSRPRRPGALRRGRLHRLPPLRPRRHRPALPLRPRPRLHDASSSPTSPPKPPRTASPSARSSPTPATAPAPPCSRSTSPRTGRRCRARRRSSRPSPRSAAPRASHARPPCS